jgi:hypothetical protein
MLLPLLLLSLDAALLPPLPLSLLQDKWDPSGISSAAHAGEDFHGGKRGSLVEGASAVVYLAGAGTMTFVDAKTRSLVREIDIVPGRMIVWDNISLLHKVDAGDTDTPRVMLGVCMCAIVFVRELQCVRDNQRQRGRDLIITDGEWSMLSLSLSLTHTHTQTHTHTHTHTHIHTHTHTPHATGPMSAASMGALVAVGDGGGRADGGGADGGGADGGNGDGDNFGGGYGGCNCCDDFFFFQKKEKKDEGDAKQKVDVDEDENEEEEREEKENKEKEKRKNSATVVTLRFELGVESSAVETELRMVSILFYLTLFRIQVLVR